MLFQRRTVGEIINDISLTRQSDSILDGIQYVLQLLRVLPLLKGYDVVQLINPCFLHLKAQNVVYLPIPA